MEMNLTRGSIVICVIQGDYGKPRPAVIVQSDLFNDTHNSFIVCPITSYLIDAPLFRLNLRPLQANGLVKESQIMVDKMLVIKREKIEQKIGDLSMQEIQALDLSLKLWLNV